MRDSGFLFRFTWGHNSVSVRTNTEKEAIMKTTRLIAGLAALALLLTACNDSPTDTAARPQLSEGTFREVFEHLYQYDGDSAFIFGCAADGTVLDNEEGERIRIFGSVYERITYMQNPTGSYHVKYQTMPVDLRGISEETGEEFKVVERGNESYSEPGSGLSGSYKSTLKMTGQTTGRVFWQVYSGNYRINPDGTVVVEREKVKTICKV